MKYTDPDAKCIITGKVGCDLHHWKTRGAGGPDESWNLMPLSHDKHLEVHAKGKKWFCEKYPAVRHWLLNHGWDYCWLMCRWRHRDE